MTTPSVRPSSALRTTLLLSCVGLVSSPSFLAGQDADFPGVQLTLGYDAMTRPGLALKPLDERFGGADILGQVEDILGTDLLYSDRFELVSELPESLAAEGVNYAFWDQLNTTWVVAGQVTGEGVGYTLSVEVHDVVYAREKGRASFSVPPADDPGFRMAIHRAADWVVEEITGEPGMAASRVVFPQRGADGIQDLWAVDADGANLTRLTRLGAMALSPSWAPDGSRIAFTADRGDVWRIYELDLATGTERAVDVGRNGLFLTPEYSPDGRKLSFSILSGGRSGIYTYDLTQDCCLQSLTGGRWEDLSPTWSPDARRIAFNTNRLAGSGAPQIYVMAADGSDPEVVSPYQYGSRGFYTSPDWSPTSDRVAFHGRITRGRYQILVADLAGRSNQLTQLTREGNNEDPSWAPDGRHLVFVGTRNTGTGLYVVDSITGRIRVLVPNVRARTPAWSPALGGATQQADGR